MEAQTDQRHHDANRSARIDKTTQRTEAAERWDHSTVLGAMADAHKRAEWEPDRRRLVPTKVDRELAG
jgi:hypothetical protein